MNGHWKQHCHLPTEQSELSDVLLSFHSFHPPHLPVTSYYLHKDYVNERQYLDENKNVLIASGGSLQLAFFT